MSQCKVVDGFYVCELEVGHRCRHRDKDHTWMDESITALRAQARQSVERKDDGEALKSLFKCLEGADAIIDWKPGEHLKAMWLDMILERYRAMK